MTKTDGLIVRVPRAAEILKVSTRTIRRWAASGELPPLDKGDGRAGSYTFETGVVLRKAAERSQKGVRPRKPRRVPIQSGYGGYRIPPGRRGSTT